MCNFLLITNYYLKNYNKLEISGLFLNLMKHEVISIYFIKIETQKLKTRNQQILKLMYKTYINLSNLYLLLRKVLFNIQ